MAKKTKTPVNKKTDISGSVETMKGMKRMKDNKGGFVDVKKVKIRNLNIDYGLTEEIIKKLIKNKLFPTVYDWESDFPWVAKHELLLLIEKMFLSTFNMIESLDENGQNIEAANILISKLNDLFEGAPADVKEYLEQECFKEFFNKPETVETIEGAVETTEPSKEGFEI